MSKDGILGLQALRSAINFSIKNARHAVRSICCYVSPSIQDWW